MRIGHGYDVHRFGKGDHLILGGVRIAFTKGFVAHSDGDVAIHALCDALLGAAALGDIGQHFPDTSSEFENIDSRILLRKVVALLTEKTLAVSNVDITIIAQAPKMAPHIMAMCENLAADLNVDVSQVNVKATTTEGLGFAGRGEGIATHAVVLLVQQ
ncbi:MAG TPA: 2-C-methyl-D-erythritol 2,4-cyclodiphosphate synthase [Gammaproteobacteria bacterium]|nr:2-C-methyl-D-erythritol 2,4-cyclodiphosphate synthase [Gammaproteobacteria bacterium]